MEKNKIGQTTAKKIFLISLVAIILIVSLYFILADITITEVDVLANGTIITEDKFEYEINFSTDYLNSTIWSWNDVNYTFNDYTLLLHMNFDNRTTIPCNGWISENETCVADLSIYGRNGTVLNGLNWVSDSGYRNSGSYNFTVNDSAGKPKLIQISTANAPIDDLDTEWTFSLMEYWNNDGREIRPFRLFSYSGWLIQGASGSCQFSMAYYNATGINKNYPTPNTICPEEEWFNYIGTFKVVDSTHFNITHYINGVNKGSVLVEYNGTLYPNSRGLQIGGDSSYTSNFYYALNGSIDDVIVWNRTLTDAEIKQVSSLQLTKYDSQNWSFYLNNSLDSYVNSTNPTLDMNYFLCVTNKTNINCTEKKIVTKVIESITLNANFTNTIGTLRNDFYGVNIQRMSGSTMKVSADGDGVQNDDINWSWHKEKLTDANIKTIRELFWLTSYFEGIPSKSSEGYISTHMNYTTVISNTTCGTPFGWGCGIYLANSSNANIYFGSSTDAHSGQYSTNLTFWSNSSVNGDIYQYITIHPPVGHYYNLSAWMKSTNVTTLRIIRLDTFAAVCSDSTSGTGDWELQTCLFNYTDEISQGLRIDFDVQRNRSVLWDDLTFTSDGVETTYWYKESTNLTKFISENQYMYDTNGTMLYYMHTMPDAIVNWTDLCSYDSDTCEPTNCTAYANMIIETLDVATQNRTVMPNMVCEILNEPYGGFLLDGPGVVWDDQRRADAYNRIFSCVYPILKEEYPNCEITGPAGYNGATNMMESFASNFSQNITSISVHSYGVSGTYSRFDELISTETEITKALCNTYNMDCQHILWTELNAWDYDLKNESSMEKEYEAQTTSMWMEGINKYPELVSLYWFQWSNLYKYSDTERYPEYPQLFDMVAGPELENILYAPYNATKKVSNMCPPQSTVKESYSPTTDTLITTCIYDGEYNIIVDQMGEESKEIIINLYGEYPYSYIINYETNEIYELDENNSINIGVIDQWNTYFLTSSQGPIITFKSPTPNDNQVSSINSGSIVANITHTQNLNTSSFIDFDNSLVGYWPMDYYNSTGCYDNSSFNNFGRFTNGLSSSNITLGARGYGLAFDGSNDILNTTNSQSLNISRNITINAWVNISVYENYKRIVAKSPPTGNYPFTIYGILTDVNSSGIARVRCEFASNNIQHIIKSSYGVNLSELTMITCTYNGTGGTIYINGESDNSTILRSYSNGTVIAVDNLLIPGYITTNNVPVTIGSSYYVGDYFNGIIDEAMIFNRSLSADEVKALYDSKNNELVYNYSNISSGYHKFKVYAVDEQGIVTTSTRGFFVNQFHIILKKIGHLVIKGGSHIRLKT